MSRTTRRAVLLGLAAGSAGARARAADDNSLVFMTPFGIGADFIEMENGVSGGYWAREGLRATVVGAPGTSVALAQVISGQAQFGMCSGMDYMRVVATKGAPLIATGTISQVTAFMLASLKEKPVLKGEDLAGKTVGVLSMGGTAETYVDLIIGRSGLKKSDVTLVVAGNSPGEAELIRKGRIDCFVCTYSTVFELERRKEPVVAWSVDRYAPSPGQVYWTHRDLVAKRPDYVRRVMRGLKASVEEVVKGPIRPLLERAQKDFDNPGMDDPQRLADLVEATVQKFWLAEGKDNLLRNMPQRYEAAAQALRAVGIADIKNPEDYYTNDFL